MVVGWDPKRSRAAGENQHSCWLMTEQIHQNPLLPFQAEPGGAEEGSTLGLKYFKHLIFFYRVMSFYYPPRSRGLYIKK